MLETAFSRGANLPVAVLQKRLQEVTDDFQRSDPDPYVVDSRDQACDVYGSDCVVAQHHGFCGTLKDLTAGTTTVAEVRRNGQTLHDAISIRHDRRHAHLPYYITAVASGCWVGAVGLNHLLLYHGTMAHAGAAALGVGLALAAWGGSAIRRLSRDKTRIYRLEKFDRDLIEWASTLGRATGHERPSAAAPEPEKFSAAALSPQEKAALRKTLALEIAEEERKQAGRVERGPGVVHIGGLRVPTRPSAL